MKGQILAFFVLCAALSIAFSSPLQQNALHVPTFENVNRCFQPLANGLCLAYFPSYYYSPGKKTCEQFIYGGCGGNENRFPTFTACMAACEGVEPEEKEFKLIVPSETIDPCSQPSDSGPCRAGMPRFYFNGDICEPFLYGGCQGNANNFISLEECQQRCGTKSSDESNEAVPTSETKSEETSEEQPQSEESEKNE